MIWVPTAITREATLPIVDLAHCTSSFRSSPSRYPVKDAHPVDFPTPRELYRRTVYPLSRRGSVKS